MDAGTARSGGGTSNNFFFNVVGPMYELSWRWRKQSNM
jgi:hypothetical protein